VGQITICRACARRRRAISFTYRKRIQPQKLTRNDHTDWDVEAYRPDSGPVGTQNLDVAITIQANATTGNVTLTGVGIPFTADMVGRVIRIDDRDLSDAGMERAETGSPSTDSNAAGTAMSIRRASAPTAGPNAPVHTEGDVSAGQASTRHGAFCIAATASCASRLHQWQRAAGTVLSQLPSRWSPAAAIAGIRRPGRPGSAGRSWSPSSSSRLGFFRGDKIWLSAVDDPEDMDLRAGRR
jgi:hypothetical protein